MKYVFALTCLMLLLQGCSSVQRKVIASDENFLIIQTDSSDSYESLAKEHLGDEKFAGVLRRYNPNIQVSLGSQIAIPKTTFNKSAVFSNGYQTVPVLCYHQFTTSTTSKNKMVVTENEFREQMKYLHDNEFNVISLTELSAFINGEKELPQKSVVITIDDGYKSYLNVALPILKEYDFHSIMYVYPEFVGAPPALKWRDVKALSKDPLVDIQSHSKTHASLSPSPKGEQDSDYLERLKVEVEGAEQILSKRTGQAINHFAYPYGNSSLELIELLKNNEYYTAVTVHKGSNPAFSAPFLIHRTMIYGGDSIDVFIESLDVFNAVPLND